MRTQGLARFGLLAFLGSGCGASAERCEAGTRPCWCEDMRKGEQSCLGSSWTVCECDPPSSGSTGEPTTGPLPDAPGGPECDQWVEDCPPGMKCMPWATDGGNTWNSVKCSPIDPEPAQPGEPCVVEGTGVSGVDNCDLHSMCWDVDPETNGGVCRAMCVGSEADPGCEMPGEVCVIFACGHVSLCHPGCDPLLQDCGVGETCLPHLDRGFGCALQAGDLAYGEPCVNISECAPGLMCIEDALVPGCDGDGTDCCSPFCDLASPDASMQCPGFAQGQVCRPMSEVWSDEDFDPPWDTVGLCALP